MHVEAGDAERGQMRRPRRPVGEVLGRMSGEQIDDFARQVVLAHVGETRRIDQMRGIAGVEQLQEVQSALGARGRKRRELVVADLRAHAVLGLVPRTGVIDRDPGGFIEARAQNITCLVEKGVLVVDQQSHELAFGDADAEVGQQREQARHGRLTLVVLGEHKAFELGPEMAGDAGRQWRHHGLAGRQPPAFAAQ